jgi:hypothetical protein
MVPPNGDASSDAYLPSPDSYNSWSPYNQPKLGKRAPDPRPSPPEQALKFPLLSRCERPAKLVQLRTGHARIPDAERTPPALGPV